MAGLSSSFPNGSRSHWPWMKDVERIPITTSSTAAAAAAANKKKKQNNKNKKDRRPYIKDLINMNRKLINQLKKELCKEEFLHYDPSKHDDLWILRFLLSHKNCVKSALMAAKITLQFRLQHKLDETDIRFIPPQDLVKLGNNNNNNNNNGDDDHDEEDKETTSLEASFRRFVSNGGVGQDALTLVVVPDNDNMEQHHHGGGGGVIFYFNIASIDTHKLANVTQSDWISGMCYVNEFQFQWNDYITRKTGKLTKSVHIIDVADTTFSMMYDYTAQDKYTRACKSIQDCYPQNVQAYLVCHAPIWIEKPWKALKPLLPTRVVDKLDFLNPNDYEEDLQKLLQFVPSQEELPERFGGMCHVWPPSQSPFSVSSSSSSSSTTTTTTTTDVVEKRGKATPPTTATTTTTTKTTTTTTGSKNRRLLSF